MGKKIRVGIIFGGKSAEHEVSLLSAKTVYDALDKTRYEPVLIGVDKKGQWHLREEDRFIEHAHDPKKVRLHEGKEEVALIPKQTRTELVGLSSKENQDPLDVVFPIIHGTNGEDGTIQGLLKLADIPFVGASVLGSAIGMDKDVAKRLLRDAGLPIAKFITVYDWNKNEILFEQVVEELGLPFFVKPANCGSSVGVSKVKSKEDFARSMNKAFLYDRKVLIEEFIKGREIECSVLGNDHPIASLPGEVIARDEFNSYDAKYVDDCCTFIIPVPLPKEVIENLHAIAIKAYKVLCCEGMARVDCFLKDDGQFVINEINTIPGFTKLSVYPRLWEASGIPYSELVDRLIQLALERHNKEKQIKTTFSEEKNPLEAR